MSPRVLRPLLSLVPEDDSVLLQRVATGDVNALGVAFDRFHRDVYGVLARLRGTRVDLDDLVQTTFLALPRAAHNYDPLASARSFVIGVALQIARRERRNLVRRWKLWQARSTSSMLQRATSTPSGGRATARTSPPWSRPSAACRTPSAR